MLDKNALPEIDKAPIPGTPLADFIPISCHYDYNSLLTKTGELVQIIEVVGFEDKTIEKEQQIDLRTAVQQAICEFIPSFKYAVYLHTIRSRKNLMPGGNVPFGFASELNNKWKDKNNWDKQLTNTLYITIVRQGHAHNPTDLGKYIESAIFPLYKSNAFKALEENNQELTKVTDLITHSLKIFGAKRLTLVKTNKGYLSEPLFFYHNLIHLTQKRTPLPVRDLSEYLANLKIEFLFNSAAVISASGTQFAGLYTIKDCVNIPEEYLDKFLQSGAQFVDGNSR